MPYRALTLLLLAASLLGQTPPSVDAVTNAALPAMDFPGGSVHLRPRSMGAIFGANLAAETAAASPPWPTTLGGIEVHLIVDTITIDLSGPGGLVPIVATQPCQSNCELIAPLIYVSPTQINFVTPDPPTLPFESAKRSHIVLVRNGVRFDVPYDVTADAGLVYIDPSNGDSLLGETPGFVVFHGGYDCLFSFSLSDPGACGRSWTTGPHRAAVGAVTDSSGQLIGPANPAHQGEPITFWSTGLMGLQRGPDGLLSFPNPYRVPFGVAQNGADIPGATDFAFTTWAGESPEYVGLDQINLPFPTCSVTNRAVEEKRYDAFLTFQSLAAFRPVRIYLPFVVRPGDPDCQWSMVALRSIPNPAAAATFTTTSLSPSIGGGDHSLIANYSGSAALEPSTSAVFTQFVRSN
jgi:hypothetical protein